MLVVISDLHFVDGTAGQHNLPAEAFRTIFLNDIVSLARDKGATELKVLLLGDIPDLLRSEQWFAEEIADRPWGKNGLQDIVSLRPGSRTEQRCLKILGQLPADGRPESVATPSILAANWETFEFFRNLPTIFCQQLGRTVPVELIYIVGNHDRLVNLYPSVRDELRKIMGLTITSTTINGNPNHSWWYLYDFIAPEYALYARHGHEYDPFNFADSRDRSRPGYLNMPIGDLIATEFAVNLPYTMAGLRSKYPAIDETLINNLKELDNIRPTSAILEWFYYRISRERSWEIRQALDETFDTVIRHFLNLDFVGHWHSPDTYWDELARLFSTPFLRWLPQSVLKLTSAATLLRLFLPIIERSTTANDVVDGYAEAAYQEPIWRNNQQIQFILYGHTHQPLQQPLEGQDRREVIYVNTGTWRGRLHRTIPLDSAGDFIKLKQMTYATFYHAGEDQDGKKPGTVSCDIWTGHKKKQYR